MDAIDLLWLIVILAGTAALLYRSVWKSGGPCGSCAAEGCSSRAASGSKVASGADLFAR